MATYRFVGDTGLIVIDGLGRELYELGQTVELGDDAESVSLAKHAHLIPAATFNQIFTDAAEIEKYATRNLQANAPASFQRKLQAAVAAYIQFANSQPSEPEPEHTEPASTPVVTEEHN